MVRVGFSDTVVADAALVHLKGLTHLQQLNVGQTQVTDAGAKSLGKALPKLQIHR